MTPRRVSIHQVGPESAADDGTLDTMLLLRRLLRELGFGSEIFLEGEAWRRAAARPAGELDPRRHDLLLIHYRACHEDLERVAGLRCRKALFFHGIAPPQFFTPNSRDYDLSIKAYAELAELQRLVEAAIAPTSATARQLRQRGYSKVASIPLFQDWAVLRGAAFRTPPASSAPAFRILNIGRFARYNRQHELIDLVRHARSIGGLPLDLVLIGQGEADAAYRSAIERDIGQSGLGGRVVLTENASPDALVGYFRSANAYVSLGESDDAIRPILQAMALDLPAIVFAPPAVSEILVSEILGEAAIVLDDGRPGLILGALQRLYADGSYRRRTIRDQRHRVFGDLRSAAEAFRDWLFELNLSGPSRVVSRLSDWRHTPFGRRENSVSAAVEAQNRRSAARYLVSDRAIDSYGAFHSSEREIAQALAQLPERSVSLERAGAAPGPAFSDDAERIVTIDRASSLPAPPMLGDVRLVHLPDGESAPGLKSAEGINLGFDGVLVASEFAKRIVRDSGVRQPIAVIGRGIDDIAAQDRPVREPVSAAAPLTFLAFFNDGPQRDIEDVLTAYCLAFTSGDPVLLVICPLQDDQGAAEGLVARFAEAAFSPAVQVIDPPRNPAELALLYRLADAVLLPLFGEETIPASAPMARGIPVIAPAIGGHLDYCNADNATLIDYEPEASPGDFSAAVRPVIRLVIADLVAAFRTIYGDGRSAHSNTATRAQAGRQAVAGLRWCTVAEKIDDFVLSLDEKPVMNRKIRVAWLSTYNVKCGLATHSEHLLEHFDRDVYDITIIGNRQEPLRADPPNMVRLWPDRSRSLGSVREYLRKERFDALFVNFHFSLMGLQDLAETLRLAQAEDLDTYVTIHKTEDMVIGDLPVSLGAISAVLRDCTRLIVHTELDVARLKSYGVADNVLLIPPGVIERESLSPSTVRTLLGLQQSGPLIGTFGFLLPPKGLRELIHGFALLLRHYPDAGLIMLNAEYPGVAASGEERDRCRALVRELGLTGRVMLVDEFLDTEEILLLLNACDATVFPYQNSGESDSGAVRLGLAAGRPVITTPLPIFANLTEVTHQLSGLRAADIAEGMSMLLRDPELADAIVKRQQDWIYRNGWSAQAARIGNVMRGCFEERQGVALRPPAPNWPDEISGHASRARDAGSPGPRELLNIWHAAAGSEISGEIAEPGFPANDGPGATKTAARLP